MHGVDAGKTTAKTSHNEEAGAFQVSADSMGLGQSLKDYAQATLGATDDATFISRHEVEPSRSPSSTRCGCSGSPSGITGRSVHGSSIHGRAEPRPP